MRLGTFDEISDDLILSDEDDGETVVFTARMPDGIIDRYDVSSLRTRVKTL